LVGLGLAVAGLALTPPPPGHAKILGPEEGAYQAIGCAHIAGWDWLRATDARAVWEFDTTALQQAKLNSVYLNVSALVTNGVDGGSGYDARLRLYLSVPSGAGGYCTVTTINPFRPQSPDDSRGIGYQVYGHGGPLSAPLVQKAIAEGRLRVTATWTSDTVIPAGRHVAVKADSVCLGYLAP
jgi:hypothetical protein